MATPAFAQNSYAGLLTDSRERQRADQRTARLLKKAARRGDIGASLQLSKLLNENPDRQFFGIRNVDEGREQGESEIAARIREVNDNTQIAQINRDTAAGRVTDMGGGAAAVAPAGGGVAAPMGVDQSGAGSSIRYQSRLGPRDATAQSFIDRIQPRTAARRAQTPVSGAGTAPDLMQNRREFAAQLTEDTAAELEMAETPEERQQITDRFRKTGQSIGGQESTMAARLTEARDRLKKKRTA